MKSSNALLVSALLAALVFGSLAPVTARGGDLVGTVKRPPAATEPVTTVERYHTRDALPRHENGANCICNPGIYSVVYLTGDSLPPIHLPKEHPTMSQSNMMFLPSVLAVAVGTTVSFPNQDPFFHNVFSYSRKRSLIWVATPKGRRRKLRSTNRASSKCFAKFTTPCVRTSTS